ncbi:MAG: hypothetical protein Q4D53_03755 [Leptotrichiaceae bacterium]|nr:hypothetical protein [Leptotrichiaceae bacterium]
MASDSEDGIYGKLDIEGINIYEAPISKRIYKVFEHGTTESGMRAVVVENSRKGIEIIYQGSNPGLTEPHKDYKNWDKDWSNNLFGNIKNKALLEMLTGKMIIGNYANISSKHYKSNELGTPKQYKDSLEFAKKIQKKYDVKGKKLMRVSGHSLGGAEAIYVGSHLDLGVVAVDPAPVNNPGKYLNNGKMIVIVPNKGRGMLNKTVSDKHGNKTYEFSPINDGIADITVIIGGIRKRIGLPAIEVKQYRDRETGKLDSHKADRESIKIKEKDLKTILGR